MATLDFDVRPGAGVDNFELGSSLWSVLDRLRTYRHLFPTVDIKFDPDSPVTTPVLVHVRPHLDLLFSGYQQRLHTICIRRLRDELHPPLTLRYKETVLSSDREVFRRLSVNRTFGPTYAGEELRYPGIWFAFDDDGRSEPRPIGNRNAQATSGKDRDQEVKTIVVCEKHFDGKNGDALDEVRECDIMQGDVARAVIKVHDGVVIHTYPSSSIPIPVQLGITTAQDLILSLGKPAQIYYKTDDRMNIHAQVPSSDADAESDYFYNYFQHGLDILISGSRHNVKKIVLHTNVPGTPMFQRYKRCPWEIEGKPEDDEDDSPPRMRFYDALDTIGHFLSPREEPTSMLLDRADEEDGLQLANSASHLRAYNGIILEVADAGQITSVTLF